MKLRSHTEDEYNALPRFEHFALLPDEIRNLIWLFACTRPPHVHFLALPDSQPWSPPAPAVDIADLDKHNPGYRNRMTVILEYHRYQAKRSWHIPGCGRYGAALKDPAALRLVCPESKAAYDRHAVSLRGNVVGLKGGPTFPASLENDIFCFRSLRRAFSNLGERDWTDTARLFSMRPQIRPTQIALEIMFDDAWDCVANFELNGRGNLFPSLPRWFSKTIEWARDAKEESSTGLQVGMKPPQGSLAIDLQGLHTVFILSYGIRLLNPHSDGNGEAPQLPTNCYTRLVQGFESRFYVLDPDSAEDLQHWDIPPYVWAARQKIEQLFNLSASWRVDVKLMAAIGKTFPRHHTSLLNAPTADFERKTFAGAR